jgi:hypothetical protein
MRHSCKSLAIGPSLTRNATKVGIEIIGRSRVALRRAISSYAAVPRSKSLSKTHFAMIDKSFGQSVWSRFNLGIKTLA